VRSTQVSECSCVCVKEFFKLTWSFKYTYDGNYNFYKPIVIPGKRKLPIQTVPQTKHFFGYQPDPEEVPQRLSELQSVIRDLGLHINVSLYYKFSDLMQKIMYEYGCFDDVYQFAGKYADETRAKLKFPRTGTFNNKPFYSHEKLYYLDFNSAFPSVIKYIPSGLPDENGEFKTKNTKIGELIQQLYDKRNEAKRNGNDKLAKTLKFILSSCWGCSIRRPKIFKNKYANDVDKYMDTFGPYVIGWDDNHFVQSINPVVFHYTYPQLAQTMLIEYEKKMNDLKSKVNVLYENIDSILVNESDYLKLKDLGYLDDYELGKLKIANVFTEIAIISTKRYVATLENGEKYYHCIKDTEDYDKIVNSIKY